MVTGSYSMHFGLEKVKSLIYQSSNKLPRPIYLAVRDCKRAVEAARFFGATGDAPLTKVQKLKKIVKILTGMRKTILFYPQMAGSHHKARSFSAVCGFKMISDPSRSYDVPFQSHDVTTTKKSDIEDKIDLNRAINGKCLDISKRKVSETFEDVFGYSLSIDPLAHTGPAVKKSNENATHDGVVIDCPIPAASVEEDKVYQKLIDTRTEEGFFLNYRVAVCGEIVPLVLIMYRPSDNRFDGTSHQDVAPIGDVFTQSERKKLSRFVRAMGLDFGELDVLRDREEGRIYVVDVNNTPGISDAGEDAGDMEDYKRKWRRTLANRFEDMIARFSEKRS